METHAEQIIALLITGLGVGFASGMLGVGGCFIMVPIQYWALTSIGVDPTVAIRIAFGANLLVVLPTAFSGAMTHHKKGAVLWKVGVTFGIAGALGAFFGAFIASHLPGKILTVAFGIAVILGAIRMLTAKPPQITDQPLSRTESLSEKIRHELLHRFGIDHPILQFETAQCGTGAMLCELSSGKAGVHKKLLT